ncbi:SMP-30/gluconolactonase/LRE family protein [Pseudonocardia sp. C8]|uniref:SMP-30/gluconolactonase/LRE family protein n=1 Tax=Pseudonocardia sp. C8 TaxID=2762759 RepID=UPI001C92FDCF|nr:SMP-30/gluconolactonase/LRE family protein [Pseudonocardia sp. C8]
MDSTQQRDVVMDGLVFAESPRWHDGRLWVSDWGAGRVWSLAPDGTRAVEAEVASFPLCIDFLPDGRLLLVSSTDRAVLRREPGGALSRHADLSGEATTPWNEIVVDGHGRAYVNNIGFDFPAGEFAPGIIALVRPDGSVTRVADGLAFPNGMAVTPDGSTLLVAESYAEQVTAYTVDADGRLADRRVWAATPGDHPDGICLDRDGALWYADVGHAHCVRVREGGEVLATVPFDRGAFSCVLDDGPDPRLYVVGQVFGDEQPDGPTGIAARFPAPRGRAASPAAG